MEDKIIRTQTKISTYSSACEGLLTKFTYIHNKVFAKGSGIILFYDGEYSSQNIFGYHAYLLNHTVNINMNRSRIQKNLQEK